MTRATLRPDEAGCGRARTRLSRDGRVVLEERLLFAVVGRVRLVKEGPDGSITIGSDGSGLSRLVPAPR